MQLRRINRRYLSLLVAVVVVAGAVLAWSSARGRSSGPNPTVTFSTVSAATLATAGVALNAPATATPSAAAANAAEAAATSAYGGRAVLESHYAHCVITRSVPAVSKDCWAVSLDPSGMSADGPPEAPPQQFTYLLVLIDPSTNKLILAVSGA